LACISKISLLLDKYHTQNKNEIDGLSETLPNNRWRDRYETQQFWLLTFGGKWATK